MNVRTKSVFDPVDKDADGMRVLITRYHPRGIKKSQYTVWYQHLAPSAPLLKLYKDGILTWEAFEATLLSELLSSFEVGRTVRMLREYSKVRPVTLLCYEPEGKPCHRHLIKRLICQ